MVAYVHIEYSTYQFSEESKGGGVESIPHLPPVFTVPKKAWSWEGGHIEKIFIDFSYLEPLLKPRREKLFFHIACIKLG